MPSINCDRCMTLLAVPDYLAPVLIGWRRKHEHDGEPGILRVDVTRERGRAAQGPACRRRSPCAEI